jgi:hypothetical protein
MDFGKISRRHLLQGSAALTLGSAFGARPSGWISPRWRKSMPRSWRRCGAAGQRRPRRMLELSDRLVVMFHGQLVHEARASEADLTEIGRHMAGH